MRSLFNEIFFWTMVIPSVLGTVWWLLYMVLHIISGLSEFFGGLIKRQ